MAWGSIRLLQWCMPSTLLADEGYRVENAPVDSDALMQRVMEGPTNWLTDRAARIGWRFTVDGRLSDQLWPTAVVVTRSG